MTGTIEHGQWRLVHQDANENTVGELMEKHSTEFGTGAAPESDPQKMPKVKKGLSPVMREDDRLALMFRPDAAYTADKTADVITLRVPVTFRNIRTGVVYEKTLTALDFNSADKYMPEDTAMSAATWYIVDYYTIPAQSEIKLGHAIQDVRVDSAINIHLNDAA